MIAKKRTKINHLKICLLILTLLIIISSVLIFFRNFAIFNKNYQGKIFPSVYIDNKDFSGKNKQEVSAYFKRQSDKLNNLSFSVIFDAQPIATFSAAEMNLKFDGETASLQAFLVGRSTDHVSSYYQRMLSFVGLKKFYFNSQLIFDDSSIEDFLNNSEDKYNHPAKNALFKFENGKVVSFRQETYGLEIQSDAFLISFKKAIRGLKQNPRNLSLTLGKKIIRPEITLASANDFGIEEEIAEGVSNYSHSIVTRIHNIILAASKFNGVLIPKDKVFSFNETIGDISSYTGYQPAYIIKEGKTVLGDGGGVCQVSTTLFRVALNAGLPIVERNAHAYRVSYYENDSKPGFDATVFAPSVDLKIKNDTPAYILIQTEVDEEKNLLYFKFYGKKDDRKVQIDNIKLWDVSPPPPPLYQDDPTAKKGTVKQTDFPTWGSKASFDYKVFHGDNLTINQTFYSFFKPWQAVYLVGTAD